MKTVAQTEYAAHPELYSEYVDSSTGITDSNYFYVASKYRLGTAQAAQFQSGDQQGASWHWGSKCSAAGVCDPSATPANNALAEMPRSYLHDNTQLGTLVNWYGVTAESGSYSTPSMVDVGDSICPRGWSLPASRPVSDENPSNKTWAYLAETYELGSDSESIAIVRGTPISMTSAGSLLNDGTLYNVGIQGSYTSSTAYAMVRLIRVNVTETVFSASNVGNVNRDLGLTVRCVNK